uniref:Carboxylesterase n=1 Tax=Cyanothece sp. (strain PCC 7425 / ATCC 29141) TaxID=395961 RepID=B8HYQ3_CYAP4
MLTNTPFLLTSSDRERACLLLHGLGGGVYEMQLLGQHLWESGFTVQGILYPGHDQPCERMPRSTWQEWYGHVQESYEKLQQTYAQVTVVGFSTGCLLALHLAAHYPVDRVVLLCPYLLIRRQWFYLLPLEAYLFSIGWLLEDVPRWRLPLTDPIMHELALKAAFFRSFNLSAVRSAIELIALVKTELSSITQPTLIIQSKKDTVVDPSGAAYLYHHLPTPQKQLIWLQNSDHIIPLDQERAQVFALVRQFLNPA